jgi:hypothetical protein
VQAAATHLVLPPGASERQEASPLRAVIEVVSPGNKSSQQALRTFMD